MVDVRPGPARLRATAPPLGRRRNLVRRTEAGVTPDGAYHVAFECVGSLLRLRNRECSLWQRALPSPSRRLLELVLPILVRWCRDHGHEQGSDQHPPAHAPGPPLSLRLLGSHIGQLGFFTARYLPMPDGVRVLIDPRSHDPRCFACGYSFPSTQSTTQHPRMCGPSLRQ